jgi:hypothetical protein
MDAYTESISFHEGLSFTRNQHKTYKNRKHPSMHYDIVSGRPFD